jgi:hypothetical protein
MTAAVEPGTPEAEPVDAPAWELAEVVGVGFIVAAVTIVLFSLASGIAYGYSTLAQTGSPFSHVTEIGPSLAEIVDRSTYWATPYFMLLLFGALATAWWQVRAWGDVVTGADDDPSRPPHEPGLSWRRLLRAQSTATAAMVISAVAAASAVAVVVSTFFLYSGNPTSLVTSEDLLGLGEGLGTLVLAAVSLFVGWRLRASVAEAFSEFRSDDLSEDVSEFETS